MAIGFQAVLLAIPLVGKLWSTPGVIASAALLGLTDVDALTYTMARLAGTDETIGLACPGDRGRHPLQYAAQAWHRACRRHRGLQAVSRRSGWRVLPLPAVSASPSHASEDAGWRPAIRSRERDRHQRNRHDAIGGMIGLLERVAVMHRGISCRLRLPEQSIDARPATSRFPRLTVISRHRHEGACELGGVPARFLGGAHEGVEQRIGDSARREEWPQVDSREAPPVPSVSTNGSAGPAGSVLSSRASHSSAMARDGMACSLPSVAWCRSL